MKRAGWYCLAGLLLRAPFADAQSSELEALMAEGFFVLCRQSNFFVHEATPVSKELKVNGHGFQGSETHRDILLGPRLARIVVEGEYDGAAIVYASRHEGVSGIVKGVLSPKVPRLYSSTSRDDVNRWIDEPWKTESWTG